MPMQPDRQVALVLLKSHIEFTRRHPPEKRNHPHAELLRKPVAPRFSRHLCQAPLFHQALEMLAGRLHGEEAKRVPNLPDRGRNVLENPLAHVPVDLFTGLARGGNWTHVGNMTYFYMLCNRRARDREGCAHVPGKKALCSSLRASGSLI